MNSPKRYFKIINDSNIPFKNMHNIRNGTVLEYVRHQPELRSVQLKKEHGYISMMEESVEEVETPDADGEEHYTIDSVKAYGEAMRREALTEAANTVLNDCVPNPKTEYQRQYNITLQATAATIRSLV